MEGSIDERLEGESVGVIGAGDGGSAMLNPWSVCISSIRSSRFFSSSINLFLSAFNSSRTPDGLFRSQFQRTLRSLSKS